MPTIRTIGRRAVVLALLASSAVAFASPQAPRLIRGSALVRFVGQNTQETENPVPKQPPLKGYVLPPDKEARAVAYAQSRHELYFLDFLFTTLGLLIFIHVGLAARLRDWAERIARNRFLQAVIFAGLFFIFFGLLSLPAAAGSHWLARFYGQSVQGWASWFWDSVKGGSIAMILGIILVWLFYGLVRRSPRRWWFYAWLASLPLLVFLIFVEPLVLEPLFFRFTPLAAGNPQLTQALERVVQHAGQNIPQSRMYLMNASSKLNALNAYVTGIGGSERVVVWDTTIAQMTTPEILFVFGHEMGHYVLHHIRNGILFGAGMMLVFLFAGYHALLWTLKRFGPAWKIRAPEDWASLPVFVFIILIFNFVFTPVDNAYSRHLEHQADQYGLEVIHGIVPDAPQVAAKSFQILGEVDLDEPSPSTAVKIWFYDHPSIDERMLFAETYDPWGQGQSPAFVK